ncbi:TlpA disulfide reductase family protein [Mucilaginibacter calamicampi]|uniref:TlpA disulfide reductase family protein n=1 Tax=Mucilaginibacter calamicampi TaxID=1302352 RepID=A0ABW2Z1X6_9SPHI
MKIFRFLPALLIPLVFLAGCAKPQLQTGIWRGALKTASGNEIPFNFEITDTAGKKQMTIFNGSERFKVTDVNIKGDSVAIKMPLFDSEFKLKIEKDVLIGKWIKHLADSDAVLNFNAFHNEDWRFKTQSKPSADISGRWATTFGAAEDTSFAVGEFKQQGAKITGTFLTTTGDYRFLEGVVSGDSLYLSAFDGGNAYLFMAKVSGDKIIGGKRYAGKSGYKEWTAVKDNNAKLPDAYSLTALKPGFKKLAFTFNDLNGKNVSLSDERFKNKVVIVQIMGSWCPNCMDETVYMVNYYKKYQPKGVEIVGLAYERTTDFARSQKALQHLKERFDIPYPLLITGYTPATGEPAKSLPMLDKVLGFPTTIIIDKKGDVRKIHTGFSGPGTGEHYIEFITEFEKLTNDLLAEK